MSYYLKYRPQTVAEIDLVSVRTAFERILKSGEFSHAYLFSGPKGTGKTSSARILAKILNCEKNREVLGDRTKKKGQALQEPCGVCDGCVSVTRGTNLSVMEMDAASNRGIDDIRVLRERINLAPTSGLFAVYVIDEVHMLTTEAFNALLKTLEEPPPHAVFVLCTTELHKVPDTVISRCTRIDFYQAKPAEIKHSLAKAIQGEGLVVEDEVLDVLTQRAGGSFRDAMKILDQAAQVSKTITGELVNELTGYVGASDPQGLIDCLDKFEVKESLKVIEKLEQAGVDWSVFGTRLVEVLREQLLKQVLQGENEKLRKQLTEAAMFAVKEIKTAVVPSLPIELMVVEWCLQDQTPIPEPPEPQPSVKPPVRKTEIEKPEEKIEIQASETVIDPSLALVLTDIQAAWTEILHGVKPLNHSLEALLRAGQPLAVNGNWLTIEVAYSFHKEQLEQDRYRRMVEQKVTEIIKKPVKIKYTLGKRAVKTGPKKAEVVNVTGKVEDEELAQAAEKIFSE